MLQLNRLTLLALVGLLLFSCQKDPQKHAEREAKKMEKIAEKESEAAKKKMNESINEASAAITHATQAEMSEAISKITVPEFKDNIAANELTKKIGNLAVDFVNSDSNRSADKTAKQIETALEKLGNMEENGKISVANANQIRAYAQNIANALAFNINVVVVE